ncbi:hypothetical protein BRADI_3g29146v3 [Brachypodium distachyon]|uniref:Secreted protein n=1 Tax=Brachypodium distachyon TaxID=15368 RepID=A0A2K2CZX4_BRADI|nr:hypothetical protein BRADI_3g29146v3 [Brachypodium distachyon]
MSLLPLPLYCCSTTAAAQPTAAPIYCCSSTPPDSGLLFLCKLLQSREATTMTVPAAHLCPCPPAKSRTTLAASSSPKFATSFFPSPTPCCPISWVNPLLPAACCCCLCVLNLSTS